MKKICTLLFLALFLGKSVTAGTGWARFDNVSDLKRNGKKIIMEVDVNKKGYRKRTILPGKNSDRIALKGLLMTVPNIKPTIKVWDWTRNNKKGEYLGSFTWNKNIDIANKKTTTIELRYMSSQNPPLQRKISEPEKGLTARTKAKKTKEAFGKCLGGIGMLELIAPTNNNIIVKYRMVGTTKWIKRKINKGDRKKFPTGNKDQDIRDMVVGYAGKSAPDGWYGTTSNNKNFSLFPRRLFTENVRIWEGKATEVRFKRKGNIITRRITEGKNNKKLKRETGSFFDKDKVVILNTTGQEFRMTLGADAAKNLKYEVQTIGSLFSPQSSIILRGNRKWTTDSIHRANKNAMFDNLLKDAFSSDIKGIQLIKHIKGDKYIIVDVQEFRTYKEPNFKDYVGLEEKMKLQTNRSTVAKIYTGDDGRYKFAVSQPV